jgi:uncharacterized protein YlaN (UPF0358 family)
MKQNLLFTFFLISTLVGFTQNTPWAKRIGDYDNDDAKSIVWTISRRLALHEYFEAKRKLLQEKYVMELKLIIFDLGMT